MYETVVVVAMSSKKGPRGGWEDRYKVWRLGRAWPSSLIFIPKDGRRFSGFPIDRLYFCELSLREGTLGSEATKRPCGVVLCIPRSNAGRMPYPHSLATKNQRNNILREGNSFFVFHYILLHVIK